MKELSIEEKAQRYDETIEKFDVILNLNTVKESGTIFADDVRKILPELKESEDERIRKKIIQLVNDAMVTNAPYKKEMLAWLEKQGEHDNFRNKIQIGDKVTRNEDGVLVNLSQLNRVAKKDEKQGEQKYTQRDIDDAYLKGIADVKREVEKIDEQTEKMKKEIAEFIFNSKEDIKQRYEWIKCLGFDVKFSNEEKQDEQKSADKVEPKFHEGEWVVFNDKHESVYQVEKIENFQYILRHVLGGSMPLSFSHEDMIREWNVQDAKDGDVLVASDGSIFLFAGVVNDACKYYCALTTDNDVRFNEGLTHCWEIPSAVHPATKEQRDTLEKAMHEAGYTFDFEKKELKNIEDEIEIPFGAKDSELQEATYFIPKGFHAEIDDDKVVIKKGENPAEWSEEDEKIYQSIKDDTVQENQLNDKQTNWLRDIRYRHFSQPQKQWKPTDEQMKALNFVVNLMASSESPHKNDYYYNVFKNLRKQLKKLREE